LKKIAAARRAGIVDEHVAAPELVLHKGMQRLASLELPQVAREGERLRAGIADRARRRIEVLLRGRGEHGLRALARERQRARLPDPAASAGDNHNLAVELAHCLRPLLAFAHEVLTCVVASGQARANAWAISTSRSATARRSRRRSASTTSMPSRAFPAI